MAYIQYNLQFFAADGPGGEKTEPASSKKLDDARKDGKVAKSKDLVNAASLLAFFLSIKIFGPSIRDSFYEVFHEIYDLIPDIVANSKLGFGTNAAVSAVNYGMIKMIIIVLPFFVVGVVMSFVLNVFQVKWKVTTKPLEPKLDKFNPINGFKRIFSMNTIIELLKSVVMIALIGIIAYQTIKKNYRYIFTFYDMSLNQAIGTIASDVIGLGIKISAILLIVGAADYMYQKYKFNKDMMMTKQEVKDEYKQSEGDPQIKGQRRQKMREMSQRRMMSDLPKADVVITNPTHYAVAIQYDETVASAPVVLAKGADYVAKNIREAAKEYGIEIVENKPLARMLYNNVEIGEEIPKELYEAVAEILALIYAKRQ